jgi:hypothetical protein
MNRLTSTASIAAFISLSLCAVPLAHADDEQMLDACIQQFIATNFAGFQGKMNVRKEISRTGPPLSASNHFVITVSASDPSHGTELASAVCRVTPGGKVVALNPTHVSSKTTIASSMHTSKSSVAANTDDSSEEKRSD